MDLRPVLIYKPKDATRHVTQRLGWLGKQTWEEETTCVRKPWPSRAHSGDFLDSVRAAMWCADVLHPYLNSINNNNNNKTLNLTCVWRLTDMRRNYHQPTGKHKYPCVWTPAHWPEPSLLQSFYTWLYAVTIYGDCIRWACSGRIGGGNLCGVWFLKGTLLTGVCKHVCAHGFMNQNMNLLYLLRYVSTHSFINETPELKTTDWWWNDLLGFIFLLVK